MTNFCSRCGAQSAPDQRFCTSCGAPLDTAADPVAPSSGPGLVPRTAPVEMAGRSCPYCRFPLKEGGQVVECSSCHAVHHEDCYHENGGCAVAGCAGGPTAQHSATTQAMPVAAYTAAPVAGPPPRPSYIPPTPMGPGAPRVPRASTRQPPPFVGTPPPVMPPPPPPPNGSPSAGQRHLGTATIATLVAVIILALGGGTAALVSSGTHNRSAASTSASTTSTDTGTTPPVVVPPTTTDTTPTTPPTTTPADDVLAAINHHWQDIQSGDYHAAFQLLLPSADGSSTESTWVSSHTQDGITSVTYHFTVAWVNGNNARVNVDTLKTQDTTGCHTFSGHYLMSQQRGSWLIAQVFLTEGGC